MYGNVKKHWFHGQKDCKDFFDKITKNRKEQFRDKFYPNKNSEEEYNFFSMIPVISEIIGYENIGVLETDYNNEKIKTIQQIFIQPCHVSTPAGKRVWITTHDVTLETDGSICLWLI